MNNRPNSVPAGWHADPMLRHQLRYWDGAAWTEHVADNGVQGIDPLHPSPVVSAAKSGASNVAPFSRRNQLGGAAIILAMQDDLALPQRFGEPIAVDAVNVISPRLAALLAQDVSLTPHVAWEVAKVGMAYMDSSECIAGNAMDRKRAFFGAAGVTIDGDYDLVTEPGSYAEQFEYLQAAVLFARNKERVATPVQRLVDWFYSGERAAIDDARSVLAWSVLVIARGLNSGTIRHQIQDEYRRVPPIAGVGWHTSPTYVLRPGEPEIQRYWDGDWTDRMRRPKGRGWEERSISVFVER